MLAERAFIGDYMKDYSIPALKMSGTDIITVDGDYHKTFTHAFSVYIINENGDSIAYVPDDVVYSARLLIEEALKDENYTEMYSIFNGAFTFLPIK